MKKNVLTIAALTLLFADVLAQPSEPRKWTLDECVNYALENSSQINQAGADVGIAETRLHSVKMSRFPELHATLGEILSMGNYNSTTGSMNGAPSSRSRDLSYTTGAVTMSVPLFEGMRISNRIKADSFGLEAAIQDMNSIKKDVSILVAVKFLECLYCKNLVSVATEQLSLSEAILQKSQVLYEEGSKPRSEQVEAGARLAEDKFTLVEANGKSKTSLMELASLLRLDDIEGFDISDAAPESLGRLYSFETPIDSTVNSHPSVLSEKARIKMNESLVQVEKSALYPKLSFMGAVRTFNVSFFNYDVGWGNFPTQFFGANMNYVVGVNLSIPIYDRSQARDNIKVAKLNLNKQNEVLEERRYQLHKEIQAAKTNMEIAYEKIEAAKMNAEASELALECAIDSYESGKSSMTDMLQAKQKYLEAKQTEVGSECEYLIREKIYHFYLDE